MLLRVQAYSINLGYRKGSTMYLADALSRAYLPYDGSQTIASEVESINMAQVAHLTPSTLQEIKQHTAKDNSLQSNGKAEAAVKSAKTVMKKSRKAKTDPYLALLEYRNMPSQGMDSSPVVRLMSRWTRTQVPTLPRLLTPVRNIMTPIVPLA